MNIPERYKKQQQKNKEAIAYAAGTLINSMKTPPHITFIADSGATYHIVDKGVILKNFRRCTEKVIRSANKNEAANIEIDGKRDLILKSNIKNKIIKLSIVIEAENIADNLISLRRFVDLGLGIYLDNKTLKIFNKITGQEYLTGEYIKSNWLITLEAVNQNNYANIEERDYQKYSCTANVVSLDELLQQFQTDITQLEDILKEKHDECENDPSKIGRENETKPVHTCDLNLDKQISNRKILNLDEIVPKELSNLIKKS